MSPATGLTGGELTAVEQAAPDWEKLEREIHCPLCQYNLRGLTEPRCPECGYRFDWPDLLDPKNVHPYLFEQASINNLTSFARTLVRNGEPGEFWKTLRPHMPLNSFKLSVYWFYCAAIATLPAILVASTKWIENLRLWRLKSELERDGLLILLVSIAMVAYPLLSAGALLLFHQSMNRAKVLPGHQMRIGIYGGDAAVWMGLWMLVAIFLQTTDFGMPTLLPLAAIGLMGMFALTTLRIVGAYADYMRFSDPVAAAVLSQLLVFLVFAVLWMPLFQEIIEFFRSLP